MFMAVAASDRLLYCMETFLASYYWLSQVSMALGKFHYHVRPKCHYSWHLAYDGRFMNPRFKWTYKCESWVGKVNEMCLSCASGTRLTTITVPLAEKLVLYTHVRLQRALFED